MDDRAGQLEVDQTRRMFARVLSQWALDLMDLRRRGLLRPSARAGDPGLVTPWVGPRLAESRRELVRPDPALLSWRPGRKAA